MASLSTSLSTRLTRLSRNYDLFAWLIRLILAAAVNIYLIQLFGDFIKAYSSTTAYNVGGNIFIVNNFYPPSYDFYAYLAAVFGVPLISSLVLSKRTPELRIVPPLYVEVLTLGWFITFGIDRWRPDPTYIILFSMLLISVGLGEDRFVTSILGRSVDRNDIQLVKLTTSEPIERVMQVLAAPEVRATLGLSHRTETVLNGFKVKSLPTRNDRTVIKTEKSSSGDGTTISLAMYQTGRYNVRSTPELAHSVIMSRAYLVDLLNQNLIATKEVEGVNKNNEPLINETVENLQGFYVQAKQLSRADWIRIGFITTVFAISVASLASGRIPEGVLLAITDALVAASELPQILRRGLS